MSLFVKRPCLECGKRVPRGRRLSHICSFKCARTRRIKLKLNLKKRKESMLKSPPKLTKKFVEQVTGFFNNLFGVE